ncbi:MAG: glycosyltransferase family 4 protein [Desulfobacteraceae bacterium]|nr:glycosyltransferase family 4 protein [Desulfobacteraceae bacterium]
MKILLINKFLYPKGGDAISTLTTGKILAAHGHEVFFWGMNHSNNPDYPFQDYFVPQIDYGTISGLRSKTISALNILYSFEARKKITALLKRIEPDIVHLNNFAHQISPSVLDVIKKQNIPTVMTMHDYKMVCPTYSMLAQGKICEKCSKGHYYHCGINKCNKGNLFKSIVNVCEMYLHHKMLHIYDKIDIYISPSCFLKNKVQEMGFKGEAVHLSNCVDVGDFQPAYKWKDDLIVYVGRLSQEKGVETLINAVKDIDVKLKIIGDGPLKDELRKKVQFEKIRNVGFAGYKTGMDLHNDIKNAMFMVIPSECYENNPRTVIEAFALGKPVVGARIGGISELVKDWETGINYTSGDVADLKDKIGLMLKYKARIPEMGKNARKFAAQELNAEVHYRQLIEIYSKAYLKAKSFKMN